METHLRNSKLFLKKNLIILGIVLIIGIFSINNALTKEVFIQDGEEEIKVTGNFSTVEKALEKGNITLGEKDHLSQPLTAKVKDGMNIIIERAYPVTVQVDGEAIEVMTAHKKVADILAENHIEIAETDKIEPQLDVEVVRNATIQIVRVKQETVTETVSIPYERIIKYTDTLDKGKLKVVQKGKEGQKSVTYTVVYEDGKEISKDMMAEKIIAPAENEIVEQGTAQYLATSRGTLRFKKAFTMSATAYDATFASTGKNPGDKYYGITRMGTQVRPGVVAVDPKVIPLGTKLYVKALDGSKDYGFAVAEDTGGAIKGNKIDLYFEDPADVKKYGRRKVEVYILD